MSKVDKSKKGSFDEKIKSLCDTINSNNNFVTLSSCSGRILLLKVPKNNKKFLSDWLFVTHDKADVNVFFDVMKNFEKKVSVSDENFDEFDVFFKMEAAILHVACKNKDFAFKLMDLAKKNGFRRVGLISDRKNTVELICNENVSIPIFDFKKKFFVINKEQLSFFISKSNEKLEKSWNAINFLEREFKKVF